MGCFHKFYGHEFHQEGQRGLLPNWNAKTLIIGTFNPNNNLVNSSLRCDSVKFGLLQISSLPFSYSIVFSPKK